MTSTANLHRLILPTPFPVGPVNVYLAEGDPLTLIDTGPLAEATWAALEAGLAAHGYRVEDLRRLLITHHHVDHVGLAAEIVERSGAEVWTHPYNFAWLADHDGQRARQHPFYLALWHDSGVPAEMLEMLEQAGASLGQWQAPVQAQQPIDEGDRVALAGAEWEVLHTPGHAGGLICLWQPGARTVIASDHLIGNISSNPILEPPPLVQGPRPRRLVDYLYHLQRVAALDPAVALPGHGEPVRAVPDLVQHRVTFHHKRAERIRNALPAQGISLWDLTVAVFPRLKERPMDGFLALSEVLGHLDLLESEGRVRAECVAGRVLWQRV